ncbi:MAG: hypothetical protein WCS87_19315, partial [Methylococcaceae bacterium]
IYLIKSPLTPLFQRGGLNTYNVAFEISFDYYRFAFPLDIARFNDSHRQQIRYGYQAASLQKVAPKKTGSL